MQYLGGKHRQSKHIAGILELAGGGAYWEPFLGGGSVAAAVARTEAFDTMHLSDMHVDLVMMWQALVDGWLPPEHVSEDEYVALKLADPSAERGFVGFACSFASKWFGGYAREGKRGHVNFAAVGGRGLAKKVVPLQAVANVTVTNCGYTDVTPIACDVLYLDPPYASATGYSTGGFDSAAFWAWAQEHAESGVRVFVSEFKAPDGWRPVWSVERKANHIGAAKVDVESLYCWSGI